MSSIAALPFLKWAGGKRWLAASLIAHTKKISYKRYVEPFLGSGAIYFSLNPEKAILSDLNLDLINAYIAIRDDWQRVSNLLKIHHKNHSFDYYYKIRGLVTRNSFTSAARFIYLNRTCWNGLYRVNKNGKFNVPIGTKKNVILESDRFDVISNTLRNADIFCGDFEESIKKCGDGDLIFADPPYTVKHNFNGFIKYNENIFSWEDQIRLSNAIHAASKRGAKIILTNAAHDSVRELYPNMKHDTLSRNSVIAGSKEKRGLYEELLVLSY
ncbi:Dam family site-specific DNA-(adenine-N6)-methyltransferase [Janthinobacterium sp. J1-1]|uniref:DNA adenine methylase n=1 Tax=Janthinobacterium sp. J1-1 TaxID=3065910 RepID=UPI002811BE24|nr:Dam family site-specific DNA-(adenine-N6)-methyltransferase [Janthinobacterium sp. J1-1]